MDLPGCFAETFPLHFRNAVMKLMTQVAYGKGYQYAHDLEEKVADMECMPDNVRGREYYIRHRKVEKHVTRRMEEIRRRKEELRRADEGISNKKTKTLTQGNRRSGVIVRSCKAAINYLSRLFNTGYIFDTSLVRYASLMLKELTAHSEAA